MDSHWDAIDEEAAMEGRSISKRKAFATKKPNRIRQTCCGKPEDESTLERVRRATERLSLADFENQIINGGFRTCR